MLVELRVLPTDFVSSTFLPARGFARWAEALVGQNLGAVLVGRAKRGVVLSYRIVIDAMLCATAVAFLYAEQLVAIFIARGRAIARG